MITPIALRGWSAQRASHAEISTWRKKSAISAPKPLSTGLLRQMDEQTLLCLRTVTSWLESTPEPPPDFSSWAVLGAPRYLGRCRVAQQVRDFEQGGPSKISPHGIPHCSLHAVSGTLSMALGCHGPNFGIGGGADHLHQALLTVVTLLNRQVVPGVLLAVSAWETEPFPLEPHGDEICNAVVLGFQLSKLSSQEVTLQFHPAEHLGESSGSLEDLRSFLTISTSGKAEQAWRAKIAGVGVIELVHCQPVEALLSA